MNVLSLFDGISCGHLAFERANIPVNNYFASEIDKPAIKITQCHFPDTVQLGNVSNIEITKDIDNIRIKSDNGEYITDTIDIIIGGSPCTNFSMLGNKKGMSTASIEVLSLSQYLQLKSKDAEFYGQSYLFWEFVRILNDIKPKYFLLENVRMEKKWQNLISEVLGIEPVPINSSLFSAQNRPRLYWTNIPDIGTPSDKGITLDDVLEENNGNMPDVAYTKTVQKALPQLQKKYGYIPARFNAYNPRKIGDKAPALTADGSPITSSCAMLRFEKNEFGIHKIKDGILDGMYESELEDGRYNIRALSELEMERLQTLPDNYTNIEGMSGNKRRHAIGNGWTVDVIAYILSHIRNP